MALLLSLLLVMSGPAFAMSNLAVNQAEDAMVDCGSMMIVQAESTGFSSDSTTDCVSSPEMACASATGLIKCGVSVSFAFLPGSSIGFTDTGAQPELITQTAFYQNPFLASITPPPEHHS
jgi:hypothetical protein